MENISKALKSIFNNKATVVPFIVSLVILLTSLMAISMSINILLSDKCTIKATYDPKFGTLTLIDSSGTIAEIMADVVIVDFKSSEEITRKPISVQMSGNVGTANIIKELDIHPKYDIKDVELKPCNVNCSHKNTSFLIIRRFSVIFIWDLAIIIIAVYKKIKNY